MDTQNQAIDYGHMSDDQLIAEYRKKFGNTPLKSIMGQQGQQQAQPTQPAQPDVASLLQQAKPSGGQLLGDALTRLAGKEPKENTNLYQKYLEAALGEQAKSLYRDPLEAENIRSQITARQSMSDARKQGDLLFGGYQEDGSPIWITPPDNRKVKNVSPGLTNPYQERAVAQADLAKQEAELARQVGGTFNQGGNINQGSVGQNSQQNLPPGANPNAPPGTKISVGPYNIPVNPELTETEARTFSAIPSIQESVSTILNAVKSGVGNEGNIMEDAYSGLAIDTGFSPATFGQDKLQALQSAMNQLKRDTLFTDAGKALTAGERQIVERLFNVSGKSPEQIATDIPNGVQKFYDFVKAKQGGMYGYNPFQQQQQTDDFSNMSDEELKKIAGIQ